ncbi:CynX/NimT family MFS transporter [Alloscardovia venturai]|uniref:CynX/NimT family MFS transporter n=1 Tax=Alloscardovia venturai TaxID=1769421 RepID=A0ABW2Y6U2_9BIFI
MAQLTTAKKRLTAIFLILAGLTMRGPIVALPMFLEPLAQALHKNVGELGVLTSLPLLMFVFVSSAVSLLVEKFGLTRTMQLGVGLIVMGCIFRLIVTWPTTLVGSLLIGAGIAVLNISMPTLVAEVFPSKPGIFTTAYSAAMVVGSTLLVFIEPFVAAAWSWHVMLWIMCAISAIPCVLSFALPELKIEGKRAATRRNAKLRLLTDRRAWLFIGMFGGQSFLSYTLGAWLPSMMNADHVDMLNYSVIMVLFNTIGIPVSLVVPLFVARTRRRFHIYLIGTMTAIQIAIIMMYGWHSLIGPAYWYLFSLITCVFFTTIFVMILTYYPMKAAEPADAADISGLSQSFGYLLAAIGPLLYGVIYSDSLPGVSLAWVMAGIVIVNAWCSWQVVRINKFGLSTVKR